MIPGLKELEEWLDAMEKGQAVTEMFPRFVDGYRKLLRIAGVAKMLLLDPDAPRSYGGDLDELDETINELYEAIDATGLTFENPAQGRLFEEPP